MAQLPLFDTHIDALPPFDVRFVVFLGDPSLKTDHPHYVIACTDQASIEQARRINPALFYRGTSLVINQRTYDTHPEIVNAVQREIAFIACKHVIFPAKSSTITEKHANSAFHKRDITHQINCNRNMPLLLRWPLADRLQQSCKGLAALILAAGPSLTQIAPHIDSLYKHCITICIPRTLRFCHEHGIVPDFIVHYDTRNIQRHYYPTEMDYSNTYLVALPNTPIHALPAGFRGCCFIKSFNKTALPNKWSLRRSWLSSLIACMGLADLLGCSEINLAGADLSYTTDKYAGTNNHAPKRSHAPLASTNTPIRACYPGPFAAPDISGRQVHTTLGFFAAAHEASQLAGQMLARSHTACRNLTTDGILDPAYCPPTDPQSIHTTALLNRNALQTKIDDYLRQPESIEHRHVISRARQRMRELDAHIAEVKAALHQHHDSNDRTDPLLYSVTKQCISGGTVYASKLSKRNTLLLASHLGRQWQKSEHFAALTAQLYILAGRNQNALVICRPEEILDLQARFAATWPSLTCTYKHVWTDSQTVPAGDDRFINYYTAISELTAESIILLTPEVARQYDYIFDILPRDNVLMIDRHLLPATLPGNAPHHTHNVPTDVSADAGEKTYVVQFYIYKNVHWPMFEALFGYLRGQPEVKEIILCLPNLQDLMPGQDYHLVDHLLELGVSVVSNPRQYAVDITFVADTIAGKVNGCGHIVNVGHGTISKGYYFTDSVWTERENWADLLCVPGSYAAERLSGVVRTRVAATGMPKMDPVFDGTCSRAALCDSLGLDPARRIILYAPTFNKDLSSMYDFAPRIHELCAADRSVLIKLHGSSPPALVQHYRQQAAAHAHLHFIAQANIAACIGGADILVSDVSSVAMEFMALDKPVILYNNPNRERYHGYNPDDIEWAWRDLAEQGDSFDGVRALLARMIAGDDCKSAVRQAYARQLFADRRGQACAAVWQAAKEAVASGARHVPRMSIVTSLHDDTLFALRRLLHSIQFYSVLPIELVIACQSDSDRARQLLATVRRQGSVTALHTVAVDPAHDGAAARLAASAQATGDYILMLAPEADVFKNFDYILHQTFQANPEVHALTGLQPSDDPQIGALQRIMPPPEMQLDRYAYEFINTYKGTAAQPVALHELPPLICLRRRDCNPAEHPDCRALEQALAGCGGMHLCLSLLYCTIQPQDLAALCQLWRDLPHMPRQERLRQLGTVRKAYTFPDFEEALLRDLLSDSPADRVVHLLSTALHTRMYDTAFKRELAGLYGTVPQLAANLNHECDIVDRLSRRPAAETAVAPAVVGRATPRVMFYFFKNVHVPILLPVYRACKQLVPEVQIGFGYLPAAPQIRAGFTRDELQPITACGEPLSADPQRFRPDVTIIADSVYPWVEQCGRLVHIGHGVLSKGQYYTDTEIARREEAADLVCVPGARHAAIMHKIITTPVTATGMAKLDALFSGRITADGVRRQFGLPAGYRYLLYAPTFNDELSCNPDLAERINQVIPDERTLLIIKPHGSTAQRYRDIYRTLVQRDPRVIYADELDITPFLALADVMISDVSSAMMEFAALDKPVVLYNNPRWDQYANFNPDDIEFQWRDIGAQVNDLQEMQQAVQDACAHPDAHHSQRRRYTEQLFANKHDGRAAERIVTAALELIDGASAQQGAA